MLRVYVASLIVAIAVWFDYRERRIPNLLVFSGMILGLAIGLAFGGIRGLGMSILGIGVGVGILIIPFALGWIGAGDVKLLGAIGAILEPRGAAVSMLYGAVVGGLISLIILAKHQRLGWVLMSFLTWAARFIGHVIPGAVGRSLRSFRLIGAPIELGNSGLTIPYSVAIAVGMVIAIAAGFEVIGL